MKTAILLSLVLLTTFVACDNNDSTSRDCCTNVDTYIDFRIVNLEGENRMEGTDTWTAEDFEVYDYISNEWKASTNNVMLIERDDENCLRIFASEEIVYNSISETKLVFPNGEEDIIKTELLNPGGGSVVIKLWYNETLLWEATDSKDRFFTISK
ncbi:hypothetical protein BFP72_05735 [Reichenbachiella sp. 5M10]|uniref:hypothetical protein n=1 Tax=Reichenbachiella sp. 5M10 TaxID=1889772 RepID=UPI000C15DD22|nr:hypothetical protein [Reichenbachiella sp. 5M10]PIB34929.1 hypothetical protein BFP72_05735 [Reichenbachiella sp. 5M10]